jgi:ferredoxin/menaquinone-dependent protoporphyrinogen IX oxidase
LDINIGGLLMDIQSVKMVFFSPTGTSKAVIQGIARGIEQPAAELIDITPADARNTPLQLSETDLLVVAVPVYVGRVPDVLLEWLNAIEAPQHTPAVCVAVYGNREYDDTLLELKEILAHRGCKPIAAAAFIGEHSFSSPEIPIAVSRPDASDMDQAERFGKQIKVKFLALSSAAAVPEIKVPGNHPYRKREAKLPADFIAVSDQCAQCGVCAKACPVEAIDLEYSSLTDEEKCILCCACIKACPETARTMKESKIKEIAIRLHEMCKERKEPVFFL